MKSMSYEEYCSQISSPHPKEQEKGHQLAQIQKILIALDRQEKRGLSWDDLEMEGLAPLDFLTEIVDEKERASLMVMAQPQEKLLRGYHLAPSYKARELDANCLKWLSRQPGRNKREKMANTKRIKTVKREHSLDTGENRLALAYWKEMEGRLRFCALHRTLTPQEGRFLRKIRTLIKEGEWHEVKPWNHLPPNNTLLSHPQYSQIWQGWLSLGRLDAEIHTLCQNLDHYLLLWIEGELLYRLKQECHCPQQRLHFSREQGVFDSEFYCYDGNYELVELTREDTGIFLKKGKKSTSLLIAEQRVTLKGERAESLWFSHEEILDYVDKMLQPLQLKSRTAFQDFGFVAQSPHLMVDLFELHPSIKERGAELCPLGQRILVQHHAGEPLDCGQSTALLLTDEVETNTMLSSITSPQGENQEKNRNLAQQLKGYLPTRSLTVLSPDGVGDFEKSNLQNHLDRYFPKLEFFPKSLGLAHWDHQARAITNPNWDEIVVVADLLGSELTLTPLKPLKEVGFANHDWEDSTLESYVAKGLVWERHPTLTYPIDLQPWLEGLTQDGAPQPQKLLDLFGIEGLPSLEGLPLVSQDKGCYHISPKLVKKLKSIKLPIQKYLTQFRASYAPLISDQKVRVITACPYLQTQQNICYTRREQMEGANTFHQLQEKLTDLPVDLTLWRDTLPQLTLILNGADHHLIKKDSFEITPKIGKSYEIPINDVHVVLEADRDIWRFDVKKEASDKVYKAVVKRPQSCQGRLACTLQLNYTYGAPEAYRLTFHTPSLERPLQVIWTEGEYNWEGLTYPTFPPPRNLEKLYQTEGCETLLAPLQKEWYLLTPLLLPKTDHDRDFQVDIQHQGRDLAVDVDGFISKRIRNFANSNATPAVTYQVQPYPISQVSIPRMAHKQDRKGNWMAFSTYKGVTVALFENDFLYPEEFIAMQRARASTITLSCYVKLSSKESDSIKKYAGKYIRYFPQGESRTEGYHATEIMLLDRLRREQLAPLYLLSYHGKKDLSPPLQDHIEINLKRVIEAYETQKGPQANQLFRVICLLSYLLEGEREDQFYQLCHDKITRKQQNPNEFLLDYMGFALGGLEKESQQKLCAHLMQSVKQVETTSLVRVLNCAIQNNDQFLQGCCTYGFAEDLLELFDKAVKNLVFLWKEVRRGGQRNVVDSSKYLEFILGVLRLRKGAEEAPLAPPQVEPILRHLSLNHPTMRELKSLVEEMSETMPTIAQSQLREHQKFSRIQFQQWTMRPSKAEETREFLEKFLLFLTGEQSEGIQIFIDEDQD